MYGRQLENSTEDTAPIFQTPDIEKEEEERYSPKCYTSNGTSSEKSKKHKQQRTSNKKNNLSTLQLDRKTKDIPFILEQNESQKENVSIKDDKLDSGLLKPSQGEKDGSGLQKIEGSKNIVSCDPDISDGTEEKKKHKNLEGSIQIGPDEFYSSNNGNAIENSLDGNQDMDNTAISTSKKGSIVVNNLNSSGGALHRNKKCLPFNTIRELSSRVDNRKFKTITFFPPLKSDFFEAFDRYLSKIKIRIIKEPNDCIRPGETVAIKISVISRDTGKEIQIKAANFYCLIPPNGAIYQLKLADGLLFLSTRLVWGDDILHLAKTTGENTNVFEVHDFVRTKNSNVYYRPKTHSIFNKPFGVYINKNQLDFFIRIFVPSPMTNVSPEPFRILLNTINTLNSEIAITRKILVLEETYHTPRKTYLNEISQFLRETGVRNISEKILQFEKFNKEADEVKQQNVLHEILELVINNVPGITSHHNYNGRTLLHYLCGIGQIPLIKFLVEKMKSTEINLLDINMRTPFFYAVESGIKGAVKLLLKNGADLHIKDILGETVCDYAMRQGHIHIMVLLNQVKQKSLKEIYLANKEQGLIEHVESDKWKTFYELIVDDSRFDEFCKFVKKLKRIGKEPDSVKLQITAATSRKVRPIDFVNSDGYTALHIAATRGLLRQMEVLINSGIDINAKDDTSSTALHHVVAFGKLDCLKLLLRESSIDLEARDSTLSTPLSIAVSSNFTEAVVLLIERGAKLDSCDERDFTPLHLACEYGYLDIVKILLKEKADPNFAMDNSTTPLQQAAANGHTEIVEYLLNNGADLTLGGHKALHLSSKNGHTQCMHVLINYGANPTSYDSEGSTPVHKAALNGHLEALKLLFECNADFNAKDIEDSSVLHKAAISGNSECLSYLLKKNNILLNQSDIYGNIPLHKATFYGHTECVRTLIRAGGNLLAVDDHGSAPLHLAISNGHLETVKAILKLCDPLQYEIIISMHDLNGMTPIMHAVIYPEILNELLGINKTDCKNSPENLKKLGFRTNNNGKAEVKTKEYVSKYSTASFSLSASTSNVKDDLAKNRFHSDISPHTRKIYSINNLNSRKDISNNESCDLYPNENSSNKKKTKINQNYSFESHDKVATVNNNSGSFSTFKRHKSSTSLDYLRREIFDSNQDCRNREFQNENLTRTPHPINISKSNSLSYIRDPGNLATAFRNGPHFSDFINHQDLEGRTAFFHAISKRFENSAKILIEAGADIHIRNYDDQDPLDLVSREFKDIIQDAIKLRDQENTSGWSECVKLFNTKPEEGISYAIKHGIIDDSPESIAMFLMKENGSLNSNFIGELISSPENHALRTAFANRFDFTGLTLDQALRIYLSTFSLPGEAQKIDRVVNSMATRYVKNNPEIFPDEDTVLIIAFALIMLNTDLHNPSIPPEKKMTKSQYIHNHRKLWGPEHKDPPLELLESLYESIKNQEIRVPVVLTYEGYLKYYKRSGTHSSHVFWFVLHDQCLFYYKSKHDAEPIGMFSLKDTTIKMKDRKSSKFSIVANSGDMFNSCKLEKGNIIHGAVFEAILVAETPQEAINWVRALKTQVEENYIVGIGERTEKLKAKLIANEKLWGIGSLVNFSEFYDLAMLCESCYHSESHIRKQYGTESIGFLVEFQGIRMFLFLNNKLKRQYLVLTGNVFTEEVKQSGWDPYFDWKEHFHFDSVIKKLSSIANKNLIPECSLQITGHSLGALAAVFLAHHINIKTQRVITFGQPLFMTESTLALFANLTIIKVIDINDPVESIFAGHHYQGHVVTLLKKKNFFYEMNSPFSKSNSIASSQENMNSKYKKYKSYREKGGFKNDSSILERKLSSHSIDYYIKRIKLKLKFDSHRIYRRGIFNRLINLS